MRLQHAQRFVADNIYMYVHLFSVSVLVCDEGEMLATIDRAEGAKIATAVEGKEGEKRPTPRASVGGLFDVILLGGGVGSDAAELAPHGEGPRGERVGAREGPTPAERLDLVLDRCEGSAAVDVMLSLS